MLISHALARAASRAPLSLLATCALGALFITAACGKSESESAAAAGSGGALEPSGGAAGHATVAGAAGVPTSSEGGTGGDAGAGGEGPIGLGGASGDAGAVGAPPELSTCEPGGRVFAAGNYVDAAGNALWLRKTETATTLARVPGGAPTPSKRPALWVVERACADGNALILRDATSSLRLDVLLSGSALLVCFSGAVPTLAAAYALPAADHAHAADTGCGGKPFLALTRETQ